MPFTPFHFGPGASLKCVAPKYFSFIVFMLSQVLIDIEPLYYMLRNEWPIHRFFHTYLGATFIVLITYGLGRPVAGIALSIVQGRLRLTRQSLAAACVCVPKIAVFSAAVLGAYSHVALDSIMHSDIRPLAPFSNGNPFYLAISVAELHLYCVIAGVVGAVGMGFWWLVWQERD